MQGCFEGFIGLAQKDFPNIIYQWCNVHRFNLAIEDAIKEEVSVQELLEIINDFSVLTRDSDKRMTEWEANIKEMFYKYGDVNIKKKPVVIKGTRWWSKPKSLNTVIANSSSFVAMYISAHAMTTSKSLISRFEDTLNKQRKVFAYLMKYENIVFAHILNALMSRLQVVTSNLQKNGLYIGDVIKEMFKINLMFTEYADEGVLSLINNAKQFADDVVKKLKNEEKIPQDKTVTADDNMQHVSIAIENFLSGVIRQFHLRFLNEVTLNEDFYVEIKYLNPMFFRTLNFETVSLNILCNLARIDQVLVLEQLKKLVHVYNCMLENIDSPNANDIELTKWNTIFKYLSSTENSQTYAHLIKLYKYVLSLPTTEVKCERDFSHLRYVKNYLRNQMGQEYLESEMIVYLNKDMLNDVDFANILIRFSCASRKMKKLLLK